MLTGDKFLIGDQGNQTTLKQWIDASHAESTKFDVIIDDGGHENAQIYESFNALFGPALVDGGLYFIEDMHVGRFADWRGALTHDLLHYCIM